MAERWYLSIDGQQEGDFSTDEARGKIQKNQGKRILVWAQGMAQWADPAELAQFRAPAPAPAPVPIPPPAAHAPAFGAPSHMHRVDADEIKKQAGILKTLLDFRFNNFVTGKIIPIIYVILLIVTGLAVVGAILVLGIGGIITGIRYDSFMGIITGLGIIVLAPILGVLQIAYIRIVFEFMIVVFRIKEDLTTLVERSASKEKKG